MKNLVQIPFALLPFIFLSVFFAPLGIYFVYNQISYPGSKSSFVPERIAMKDTFADKGQRYYNLHLAGFEKHSFLVDKDLWNRARIDQPVCIEETYYASGKLQSARLHFADCSKSAK